MAYQLETRGRGRDRGSCSGRGRSNPNHDYHMSQNLSHIRCYNCKKISHYAGSCTVPGQEYTQADNKAHDDEPMLLMAQIDGVAQQDDVWYLDSGASNHLTGSRRFGYYEAE